MNGGPEWPGRSDMGAAIGGQGGATVTWPAEPAEPAEHADYATTLMGYRIIG